MRLIYLVFVAGEGEHKKIEKEKKYCIASITFTNIKNNHTSLMCEHVSTANTQKRMV